MNQAAIDQLVRDRKLEERPSADDELAGYWANAVKAYHDALVSANSLEGRYERAYTAARIAATAAIRANGYRVKGTEAHHYVTFTAARHLTTGKLADAFVNTDQMRSLRHDIEYEYENDLDAETLEAALDHVEMVLQETCKYLRKAKPEMKQRFRQIKPRKNPNGSQ
jgi:hypothetical protein